MARTGVTLLDVEKAALQLQGRGKNPTVDNIRELLSTGSKSTIAQHLKNWKLKNNTAHGKLPAELLALVTGMWERLNVETDTRIDDAERIHTEKLEALQNTLHQSQQAMAELNLKFQRLEEDFFEERKIKEDHIKWLHDEKHECIKWQERHQETSKLIETQKSENLRLHQLATNMQANLEHYQDASQKARIEQSLVMENQQQQFHQEKKELQNALSNQQEQLQVLQRQIEQKNTAYLQIKNQVELLQENQATQIERLEKNSLELAILQERNEQAEKQTLTLKDELTLKNAIILKLEKELAVLSDIRHQWQEKLSNAENKIEILRQEKLFLAQEKSELQGYIKQWESIKK